MTTIAKILLLYLACINLLGVGIMGLDKWKARHNRWRIPERRLFLTSFFGGSLGTLIGMRLFHHKTRHIKFLIGMPAILLFHIAAIYYFCFYHHMIVYLIR